MLFTNKRQYTTTSSSSSSSSLNPQNLIFQTTNKTSFLTNKTPLSSLSLSPSLSLSLSPSQSLTQETSNILPNKINWGKPTWYLFHTMIEKLKEEYFLQMKVELFNIITIICINLPCPICATHAKTYLDGIQIRSITTKQQFKEMLFHFHNHVNHEKKYPLFSLLELDDLYRRANMTNIIQHFMQQFRDKSRNLRLISNEMYRNMIIAQVSSFLSKYSPYFDS